MANIYFSTLDRKQLYELPILPEEMPELSKGAKNEIFETFNNGEYNFLGETSLISFSLEVGCQHIPINIDGLRAKLILIY